MYNYDNISGTAPTGGGLRRPRSFASLYGIPDNVLGTAVSEMSQLRGPSWQGGSMASGMDIASFASTLQGGQQPQQGAGALMPAGFAMSPPTEAPAPPQRIISRTRDAQFAPTLGFGAPPQRIIRRRNTPMSA